jgi:UDP-galactopyranose mutase
MTFDNNYYNNRYHGIPKYGYTKLIERMLDGIPVILGEYELGDGYARHIIYTGALDELFGYKHGSLEYRSLDFTTYYFSCTDNYQGVAVINDCGAEHAYTRVIEHKHFLNTDVHGTVVTFETPCKYEQGKERYYTVNDTKNQQLYEMYKKDLQKHIQPLGRLAEYKYIDMAEAVRGAIDLFNKYDKSNL